MKSKKASKRKAKAKEDVLDILEKPTESQVASSRDAKHKYALNLEDILKEKVPPVSFQPIKDAYSRITAPKFFAWVVGICLVLFLGNFITAAFKNPESIRDLVLSAGNWGPLILVLIIALEVLFTPIPGSVIAISAGYFYNWFPGVLYAWMGTAISALFAFYLGHRFGHPLVRKMLNPHLYQFYDDLLKKNKYIIALVYAVPIFPVMTLSFLVGLSEVTWKRFIALAFPALVVNMLILTYLGHNIAKVGLGNGYVIAVLILLLLGAIGIIHLSWQHSRTKHSAGPAQKGKA